MQSSAIISFLVLMLCSALHAQQIKELRPILSVMSADTGAQLGEYLKGVGDINKDGFADVVVSAAKRKLSYLYYGGNPMSPVPALTFKGGGAIASGDFNGDGWIDLAIGYLYKDIVFIYLGNPTGMDTIPDVTLSDELHPVSYNGFGNYMAGGDVGGDGIDDLVVGGNDVVNPENEGKGKIYIYEGGRTLGTIPKAVIWGDTIYAGLGWDVLVGDINNDKKKEIIVLGYNQLSYHSNEQFYYFSIFSRDSAFTFTRTYYKRLKFEGFGQMLLRSFDVDGDKIDDLLVSGIDIYKGGSDFDTTVDYHIPPLWNDTTANGIYPSVSGGGDFNGDGKKDFLMGTLAYRVLLYLGGPQGLKQDAVAFVQEDPTDCFGYPFENAGDVNGDGVDDIIIGAIAYPLYRGWGAFYIFPGDKTLVTSILPDQQQKPEVFALKQNYPNPFNPSTTISYELSAPGHVRLKIIDVLGKEVIVLVDDDQSAGSHSILWNGKNKSGTQVSSGIYFYQLQADNTVITKKATYIH